MPFGVMRLDIIGQSILYCYTMQFPIRTRSLKSVSLLMSPHVHNLSLYPEQGPAQSRCSVKYLLSKYTFYHHLHSIIFCLILITFFMKQQWHANSSLSSKVKWSTSLQTPHGINDKSQTNIKQSLSFFCMAVPILITIRLSR